MQTWLKPKDVGLEFGSGRSTAWFAGQVGALTSVEHDRNWYDQVSRKLDIQGLNVDYRFHPSKEAEGATADYVKVCDSIADDSLDFVLVDRILREHCALAAVDKIKPGGILITDNVNWYLPRINSSSAPSSRKVSDRVANPVWGELEELISQWRYVWTTDGVTDTGIWFKPPTAE